MTDFTNVRDLSQFEYCPLCGEKLHKEVVPEGLGEYLRVTCPKHHLLVFPHTGLQWPGGGRRAGEDHQMWAAPVPGAKFSR